MIDTQAIRSKILDLAMRGKLTEQLPEDGTAEELYRQIQAEKQKLIKAGKIKKGKPLPEIADGEVPFEIPANWKWIRLNELGTFCGGKTPSMANEAFWKNGSINWVTSKDMKQKYISASEMMITKEAARELNFLPAQTVLFVVRSGILRRLFPVAILSKEGTINQDLKALHLFLPEMCEFVYSLLKGFEATILFKYTKDGTTVNNIVFDDLLTMPVPLPPLAEQHRIVARIEQAFSALDTIDALQAKHADNLAVLESKLIDAAIRGKLTEQLPEDGTAEELYRQIQAEKQALIKAGKLKKEKPLPEIAADEAPFEIPKSWKWVRTGDVFSVGTGLTPLTNEKRFYENGRIPWVTSSLTSNRYIQDATTYLSEYALEATSLRLHPKHTLIIAMYGEGKTRGQIAELLIPATTNQACATLDNIVYNQATVDYVYFFFTHNYVQLRSQAGGSNQPNLNLNKIKETPIPLPPLAEQKRIVDRINELLAVCDELKSKGNP